VLEIAVISETNNAVLAVMNTKSFKKGYTSPVIHGYPQFRSGDIVLK